MIRFLRSRTAAMLAGALALSLHAPADAQTLENATKMEECLRFAVYLTVAAEEGSGNAEMKDVAPQRFEAFMRRYAALAALDNDMGPAEAQMLFSAWKQMFPMAKETVVAVEMPADPDAYQQNVKDAETGWPQACASDAVQFTADEIAQSDAWMKANDFAQ